MRAARGQPEHRVALGDRRAVDDAAFFDDADRKTGKIVLARRIHAGHLGGLAADQRAACLLATGGDALDHPRRGRDVELAAGEIIEEEQRLGALHQDIVDAHRDEIDADRVVAVELECEFELGADAVGAGNQHRFAVLAGNPAQRAETADTGEHFGPHGFPGKRLDVLHERVAGVDIDTGIAIGQWIGTVRCAHGAPFWRV